MEGVEEGFPAGYDSEYEIQGVLEVRNMMDKDCK